MSLWPARLTLQESMITPYDTIGFSSFDMLECLIPKPRAPKPKPKRRPKKRPARAGRRSK